MRRNELMLYRHMEHDDILEDMAFLMDEYQSDYYNQEDLVGLLYECVNKILELSMSHGLEGNLWHTYLTFLLANDENAYSTACEITGPTDGSINEAALHDFQIFHDFFHYVFRIWKHICPRTVCLFLPITPMGNSKEAYSISESVTASVSWQKLLLRQKTPQNSRIP